MTTLKTLTIVAALLVGSASLAVAQNGPATGGEPPVAGGAAGNPAVTGSENTAAVPGTGPAYIAQPGYVGTAAPRVHTVQHRSTYMYVPPHRSSHKHTITPNGGYY